jgi:hypothetical protein
MHTCAEWRWDGFLWRGLSGTGVVAAGEVVGSVFLAADELLGVEELAICASAHLIHHGALQVHHHTTRHMLARACLAEECVERIVSSSHRLVAWHLSIGLHTSFKVQQLIMRQPIQIFHTLRRQDNRLAAHTVVEFYPNVHTNLCSM